ncbi:MAG: glycosyltransferase [Chloroflexi bacterium]|nr:glycosyltransferase [Chloroflexota bacterium]
MRNWILDATAARSAGSLHDHIGMLSVMDQLVEDDQLAVLAAPELSRELTHSNLSVSTVRTSEGLGRFIALNRAIRGAANGKNISAAMFHQFAPERLDVPYVLRLTDAHLVGSATRSSTEKYESKIGTIGWGLKRFFFRRAARRAHSIICATQSLASSLRESQPEIDPGKLIIAPMGPSPVVDYGTRHSASAGNRLLTMHIRPHKNIEVILRAMALPYAKEFTLTVLGTLSPANSPYHAFISGLIDQLNLGDRIQFAGYLSNPGQVREYMMDHDILIVPSRLESWSHSLIEGLVMGMPVVASDLEVHKEVGSEDAWIFPVDSQELLAQLLVEIRENEPRRREYVEKGLLSTAGLAWDKYASACIGALRDAGGE